VVGIALLVPIWGFMGAAVSTVACYLVMTGICYFYGQKHYPVPYQTTRGLGYLILAFALSYAGFYVETGTNSLDFILKILEVFPEVDLYWILNGKGIFPKSWHWAAMDSINLKAIQKEFGSRKLKQYPITSFTKYYFVYPFIKKMRPIRLLNYIPYVREDALIELENRLGYIRYPRKHGESSFTRFFQEFFLPHRYGIDKRLPHYSSQIVSQQLTRDEALRLLSEPLYAKSEMERDIQFICRKLDISRENFEQILDSPLRNAKEFSNWNSIHKHLKRIQKIFEFVIRRKIAIFS
jgi:hypothetical protein